MYKESQRLASGRGNNRMGYGMCIVASTIFVRIYFFGWVVYTWVFNV